jgi:protein TonB
MSDVALHTGSYLASPLTDWSRERPFQIAFALSVVAHALLIAFVPGFRSVPPDAPPVLEVQIVPAQGAPLPRSQEKPVVVPKKSEPEILEPPPEPPIALKREIIPEPVRPSKPEVNLHPTPVPVPRTVQPEPVAPSRPDVIALPRVEPRPELVAPRIQPPESRPLPKVDAVPEPKIEHAPPPPVARVEPRPEPPAKPEIEPRPQPPQIEPKIVRQEAKPPQEVSRPIQPQVEPSIPPPDAQPAPPVTTAPIPPPAKAPTAPAAPTPPVAAAKPQPSAPTVDAQAEDRLLLTFSQSISKQIKRYQKYPPPAQRRGWEGTAEVLLQIAADGNVTGITLGKSSGHAILDEEALNMVRRASPLPAAPPDLRGRALVVTVPIVFRLQNS